jgi:S-adenosylmethionine:tRNA ribosyltransferase-isomerase
LKTADFDFPLPAELIAQHPVPRRDESRLLVVDRSQKNVQHLRFGDLRGFLTPRDALVINDSRVFPARVYGRREGRTGQLEMLLISETRHGQWWSMMRPAKKAPPGTRLILADRAGHPTSYRAVVTDTNEQGHRLLRFEGVPDLMPVLDEIGHIPLPPYIARPGTNATEEDRLRYQTVYADRAGSVAAPTAGLHFTPELLAEIEAQGVAVRRVTLHVGLGTFAPVKAEELASHVMHEERFMIGGDTARCLEERRRQGGRIVAVGTTSARVLETVAGRAGGKLAPMEGETKAFFYPPRTFQAVDALLTNFHLPKSTLLMLVSAFLSPGSTDGVAWTKEIYASAVERKYRFFSYGDAMLIL